MNDQDYIRKAVELADGWSQINHAIHPPWTHSGPFMSIYNPSTIIKDALAAQLVRQVDAKDKVWIEYASLGSATIFDGNGDAPIAVSDLPDRTMNTIKAIVDSSVLITGVRSADS